MFGPVSPTAPFWPHPPGYPPGPGVAIAGRCTGPGAPSSPLRSSTPSMVTFPWQSQYKGAQLHLSARHLTVVPAGIVTVVKW